MENKLKTADCVSAIMVYILDNYGMITGKRHWKRISKRGTGDNIIRIFEGGLGDNLFTVQVRSSETEILELIVDEKEESEYPVKPSDWFFGVNMGFDFSAICLSEDGDGLDDRLGSHNLPKSIINALNRAGIYGECELMEAIWEVNGLATKEEIIKNMEREGFIHSKSLDSDDYEPDCHDCCNSYIETRDVQPEIEMLERKLHRLVAIEAYEEAAIIRDQINHLKEKL